MRWIAAVCLLVAGCEKSDQVDQRVVECFSWAAYATLSGSTDSTTPKECCKECGGTGLVRSGDKLEWVPCPCPDDCECKQQKNASCKDGKCEVKRK